MSRNMTDLSKQRQPASLPSPTSTNSFWHSQPSALLKGHQSTRNLPESADVVIVGSGMCGASVAHHLLDQVDGGDNATKPNVVMLEAREACWGATGRNGGHCQPLLWAHPSDLSIGDFELSNFHTLQALIARKSIDCEFVAQPGVRAIYDHQNLDEIKAALTTVAASAPHQAEMMRLVTDRRELMELRIPTAIAAVRTTLAARMWPYKLVARVLEDLLRANEGQGSFNLQTLTPVVGLETEAETERWRVRTGRGSISAARVVLATNAYTSHLLGEFSDLIVPCRGQMSALVPLPGVAGANRLQTSLGFLGEGLDDYLVQRPNERGGHLMFGGGRQHGPSIGVTDDNVLDERTAKYLRRRLLYALGKPEEQLTGHFKHAEVSLAHDKEHNSPDEFTASHEWTGIMGFSRDELPFIGPVPQKPNLFLAAGFTGHGMPNTWLSGKSAALMVQQSLLSRNANVTAQIDAAVAKTGLPRSYVLNEERMRRAMECEDVETLDWSEMQRGSWRLDHIEAASKESTAVLGWIDD